MIKEISTDGYHLSKLDKIEIETINKLVRAYNKLKKVKESKNMSDTSSWFAGICTCGYKVVVTQPSEKSGMDYWWYCSNKDCTNHHPGEETGDMEHPDWVTLKTE